MIILSRKLFGVVPYQTVFFPNHQGMADLVERLPWTHLTRFFWTTSQFATRMRPIECRRSATICVDLVKTAEELWSGISKTGRNEIRSAERLGSRVRIGRDDAARRDFFALYRSFAGHKPGAAAFRDDILKRYDPHAQVLVAYLDGRPMCSHVYLIDSSVGRVRLLFSASRRLEDAQSSRLCSNLNRFLHWNGITTYRGEGFRTYDLGGILEDRNDGIARFKGSFGGELIREQTYLYSGSRWLAAVVGGMLRARGRKPARITVESEGSLQGQPQACDAQSEAVGS